MKSLIAMSMHKAGSSITDRILVEFCKTRGYQIDRINPQVSSSPLREMDFFIEYQKKMVPEGLYYGMARGPYVKDMERVFELKTIVQMRDPRDCITSAYFSFMKSHQPPEDPEKAAKFMERREQMEQTDIDAYALSRVDNYNKRMKVLQDIIDRHDDVLVLTYEEMVANTETWLDQIASFLGQPLTDELRATLGDDIDFSVDTEDASQHKRQVTPGDHARKLKPETIVEMNKVLGPGMEKFGYTV